LDLKKGKKMSNDIIFKTDKNTYKKGFCFLFKPEGDRVVEIGSAISFKRLVKYDASEFDKYIVQLHSSTNAGILCNIYKNMEFVGTGSLGDSLLAQTLSEDNCGVKGIGLGYLDMPEATNNQCTCTISSLMCNGCRCGSIENERKSRDLYNQQREVINNKLRDLRRYGKI